MAAAPKIRKTVIAKRNVPRAPADRTTAKRHELPYCYIWDGKDDKSSSCKGLVPTKWIPPQLPFAPFVKDRADETPLMQSFRDLQITRDRGGMRS